MAVNKNNNKSKAVKKISLNITDRHHIMLNQLCLNETAKASKKINQSEIICRGIELYNELGLKRNWKTVFN